MEENVENINKLIGRAIVSLETANKLGYVADLIADPLTGQLAGFAVTKLDESCALVSMLDVHGIGPDAIIVEHDQSLILPDASPLNTLPKAKNGLIGVKVITEHGQLLGKISDLFVCVTKRPVLIYEVRSSLLDSLLGRAFYFAASLGCAFAADGTALVVTGDPESMDHRLNSAAERLLGSYELAAFNPAALHIEIRSHTE